MATAVFFLLRELEAASATWEDVVVSEDAKTITLTLPSSKTDWAAKGCRRTWGCVCSQGRPCVYHTMMDYRKWTLQRQNLVGPLFVDSAGNGCSKAAVIATLREAISRTGAVVTDATGKHLYSGHAFRITGARTLSSWGLDTITLQLLGRWGSLAILSYIAEAPLSDLARRLHQGGLDALPPALRAGSTSIMRRLTDFDAMLKQILERVGSLETDAREFDRKLSGDIRLTVAELEDRLDEHEASLTGIGIALEQDNGRQPTFVLNEISGALHKSLIDLKGCPRKWKTFCGWPFAGIGHVCTFANGEPQGVSFKRCHRCFSDVHESDDSSDPEE